MTFKSIAEFLDPKHGHRPTSAERKLIAKTQAGEPSRLWAGDKPSRPTGPSDETTIRATLLRLLILGGTKECGLHERGVWLEGGWIEGELDLSFCTGKGAVVLDFCHFTDRPILTQSTLLQLGFENSAFPGILAEGMKVTRDLSLRNANSSATVHISFAELDARLVLTGATLNPGKNHDRAVSSSLVAEGLKLSSDLLLCEARCFGMVDLTHAIIGGQLDCTKATFDCGAEEIVRYGEKSDNDSQETLALSARRLHVERGFLFREVRKVHGHIMLHGGHIGDLLDDVDSWPKDPSFHFLAGFTYNRFGVSSPASIARRLQWLKRGVASYKTYAQPYTQLARVLRQAGHLTEARKVLIERTYILEDVNRAALRVAPNGDVWVGFLSLFSDIVFFVHLLLDRIALWIAGYGYAPQRAMIWALGCVGLSFFVYMYFWSQGVMVPTDAVILTSAEWKSAFDSNPTAPAFVWAAGSGPAISHYETFYSLPYALDVFLPIVDLGQQSTWGQTTVTNLGVVARIYTWLLQAAGYVITSLGLAAATGIIQRNQPD